MEVKGGVGRKKAGPRREEYPAGGPTVEWSCGK
jgi:hypothetical protein